MAILVDHEAQTRTSGSVPGLVALMESAAMIAYPARPANRQRAVESHVRAAIRRGGRTAAGQALVMSDAERAAWEAGNPVPEW